MAIRVVLQQGDPRLRLQAKVVPESSFGSAELSDLIDDLRDTMTATDGAGLAAPQIGVGLRVLIYGITFNPRYPEAPPIPETVLINPIIKNLGLETQLGWEGCLSVPNQRSEVERWQKISVQWRDLQGMRHQRQVMGFEARVVQHEYDHLDGVLFPDRVAQQSEPRPIG